MIENVMDTPMPDTSSKLSDIDYTAFLKKDSHHLSCPECEIIPALFKPIIENSGKNKVDIEYSNEFSKCSEFKKCNSNEKFCKNQIIAPKNIIDVPALTIKDLQISNESCIIFFK